MTLEAEEHAPSTYPAAPELEEAAEQEEPRFRDWLGGADSARTRILIAYVLLLALAAVVAMLGFRQFLLFRLEDAGRQRAAAGGARARPAPDQRPRPGDGPSRSRPSKRSSTCTSPATSPATKRRSSASSRVSSTARRRSRGSRSTGSPPRSCPTGSGWPAARRARSETPPARSTRDSETRTSARRASDSEDDVGAFVVTILPADERESDRQLPHRTAARRRSACS